MFDKLTLRPLPGFSCFTVSPCYVRCRSTRELPIAPRFLQSAPVYRCGCSVWSQPFLPLRGTTRLRAHWRGSPARNVVALMLISYAPLNLNIGCWELALLQLDWQERTYLGSGYPDRHPSTTRSLVSLRAQGPQALCSAEHNAFPGHYALRLDPGSSIPRRYGSSVCIPSVEGRVRSAGGPDVRSSLRSSPGCFLAPLPCIPLSLGG